MKNLEIKKFIYKDHVKIMEILKPYFIDEIYQEDIYYTTDKGRLKLRDEVYISSEKKNAYAIAYERPNVKSEKVSEYTFYKIEDIDSFKKVFGPALKIEVIVVKTRYLYKIENARIHVDIVKNLGPFLEIEVILESEEPTEKDRKLMADILKMVEIETEEVAPYGYREYLLKKL